MLEEISSRIAIVLTCGILYSFSALADPSHIKQGSTSQTSRPEDSAGKAPEDRLRNDPKLKEFCKCPASLCDAALKKTQNDRIELGSGRLNRILEAEQANPANATGSPGYFRELDYYVTWPTREADFKKAKEEILATLPDPSTLSGPEKARVEAMRSAINRSRMVTAGEFAQLGSENIPVLQGQAGFAGGGGGAFNLRNQEQSLIVVPLWQAVSSAKDQLAPNGQVEVDSNLIKPVLKHEIGHTVDSYAYEERFKDAVEQIVKRTASDPQLSLEQRQAMSQRLAAGSPTRHEVVADLALTATITEKVKKTVKDGGDNVDPAKVYSQLQEFAQLNNYCVDMKGEDGIHLSSADSLNYVFGSDAKLRAAAHCEESSEEFHPQCANT